MRFLFPFFSIFFLFPSCKNVQTVKHNISEESSENPLEIPRLPDAKEIEAIMQEIIDLPELQPFYHPDKPNRLPVVFMRNDVFPYKVNLLKFGERVEFIEPSEQVGHYFLVEEFEIKKDTVEFGLMYDIEGVMVVGNFIRNNRGWRIDDYQLIEKKHVLLPDLKYPYETLDGWLTLTTQPQELLEKLGEPEKIGSKEDWTDAEDVFTRPWHYVSKGIKLTMNYENHDDPMKIYKIEIIKPSELKTSKNIGIGSVRKEVETAYAGMIDEGYSLNDSIIVVRSIYGGIVFKMEIDKVKSICIGEMAE
ncbi:hypothetical protein [Maribacter sp. 2210JD10-5]|uniref:hypothetical protein n=1 Tax=Maribacter sp. 2210JD10-5 TaxID=3386272 RepID=UPI0039BC6D58